MDDEETDELKERIEEDLERYEPIPIAESHEGYENMVDFITTVDNEHLAELLEVAINGKGNQYTLRKGEYKNGRQQQTLRKDNQSCQQSIPQYPNNSHVSWSS